MKKLFSILFSVLFFVCVFTVSEAMEENVKVASFKGEAKIIPSGMTEGSLPRPDMTLVSGDAIKTGAGSYLDLSFGRSGKNIIRVKENSHVVIKMDGPEKLELVDGGIYAMLKSLKKGEEFRVKTPTAVCGARGTGWETVTDGKVTTVAVYDNKILVRGINADGSVMEKAFEVDEGFMAMIAEFQEPGQMVRIPEDRWEEIREALKSLREVMMTDEERDKLEQLDNTTGEGNTGDEHRQGILDRKDDERLDKLGEKEEKKEGPTDGYSYGT